MKKLVVVAVIAATCLVAKSQQPEPEFSGVFYSLDGQTLNQLEHQNAAIHGSGGGFIVAGMKANYELDGAKSPVRYKSGESLTFVVKTPLATSIDPSTIFILRKLESKKKTREIVFMKGHITPFGGGMKTNMTEGQLPLKFSAYADGVKITVDNPQPGEYAFSLYGAPNFYCFGVD
jgi:hypothetical protein